MFKKFLVWFICFGLSFMVSGLGWAEQDKAFLYIALSLDILLVLLFALATILAGLDIIDLDDEYPMAAAIHSLGTIIVSLIATWVATKIFHIDFCIAYQIMTFGQCWVNNKNKEE